MAGGDASTLFGMTCNGQLHADHGSRYASTPAFIAAVHPQTAIILVGRHNTFGHLAVSTLQT